jgi:hypothetical protein
MHALLALISATAVVASPTSLSGATEQQKLVACKAGSVPAVIGRARVCLRVGARCKARYQRAYEKKGFRCVAGRLKKKPKQPPQPQPTPGAALVGGYVFTTSQPGFEDSPGTADVLAGGRSFANLVIFWEADCSGGDGTVTGYGSVLRTTKDLAIPLDPDLGFSRSDSVTFDDGVIWNFDLRVQFDAAGSVSGSLAITISLKDGVTCNTGPITFSGKLQTPG